MTDKVLITLDDHLRSIPVEVRPIVEAALEMVRSEAEDAEEVVYQTGPPRSASFMWKLVHYRLGGEDVLGIGTFPKHSTIYFYRGTELRDDSRMLAGRGKGMPSVGLHTPEDAGTGALRRLVRQAFELTRTGAPAS